ncbi:hypothetical protein CL628_00750 [bacterium]|nr:hypothetical protein [bacterium]
MKFAVLEYSSKSGDVWRHTKETPNYLADPQTEIDPTSFGCYVSALGGEHVPLTGLILGPTNRVSKSKQFYRKAVKRLTGSWPSFDIEYLAKFDVLMIVHQLSNTQEIISVMQKLRTQPDPPFVIGVPTQPYGQLQIAIEKTPEVETGLRDFILACDVFISVVRETVGWYEDLAQTPVVYLPQPYPAAFAGKQFLPLEKKHTEILVAGVTQRDNIKQGQIVARELQKKFPGYLIRLPKVDAYEYDYSELQGARYDVLPFELWRDHLKTLAETALVVNTDYTLTRGRVQTDCAAVGTPSLGGNSDGTRDLFPQLRSDSGTSTDAIIAKGIRLLSNHEYYQGVVQTAQDRLKMYDYAESAARLQLLVKKQRQTD